MKRRAPGTGHRAPGTTPVPRSPDPVVAEPGPRSPGPREGGEGVLYVVATPIGTLADLSPRAREVLAGVELILAEDTRRVRKLLNHFGVATPARPFHEHNEEREGPALLARLQSGAQLALVSDAGTPLLADPGFRLVRACRAEGIAVLAVPGPSAVTAALSVAGLPPYPFTFAGFLPASAGVRRSALGALAGLPHTVVLFLSPHRLGQELAACAETLGGGRQAALLAELSKLHERYAGGTLAELAAVAERLDARGEYTLVVGPPAPAATEHPTVEAARAALDAALAEGFTLPDARREAARRLGVSRRELYAMLSER
jgi:16S rRNA (cytidine1402-2'-O)-methyltransferase